jgi:hypothetical protein
MTHPAHTQLAPTGANPIERYRASILAAGGFLTALLLQLGEAFVPGRPLGGIEFINLVFAALVLLGVYFPANPWAKLASAVAGAVGQTVIACVTDNRVTSAEIVTIAVSVLVALGVGALPNAPELVVGEAGADAPLAETP